MLGKAIFLGGEGRANSWRMELAEVGGHRVSTLLDSASQNICRALSRGTQQNTPGLSPKYLLGPLWKAE